MRALLGGLTAIAVCFFVYWMAGALLSAVLPLEPAMWIATAVAAISAVLAARMVRRPSSGAPGIGRAMTKGALILGAIGFVAGFFGPMVFAPGANQGPMLGLFITGPGGAVLGAIGGAIWWVVRERQAGRRA